MPKRGIPDRWLDYCKYGKQIEGTRFIAFKVPLKESLCSCLANSKEWFTPVMALHEMPNLGMVIDLTNTSRYYDPEIFRERNVKYLKILCEGHGRLPGAHIVAKFFQGVDEFIKDGQRNGQLIGVHCTHGLNRTGFFICRYMIDRMGFPPADAIAVFNDARGHKMERPEYLEALARVDQTFSQSGLDRHSQQLRRQDSRSSEYHNGLRSSSRDRSSRDLQAQTYAQSPRDPYRDTVDPYSQHRVYDERSRQQGTHPGRQMVRAQHGYQSFDSDYRSWGSDYTADNLAYDFANDVRMDSYRHLENKCVADVRRSFSQDRRTQPEDRRNYLEDRRAYPDARRNHLADERRTYSEDRSGYRRNYSEDRRNFVPDVPADEPEVCRDPSMRDFHKDQFPYAYKTPSSRTDAYRDQEGDRRTLERREEVVSGYSSARKDPVHREQVRDPDSGYGSGRSGDYAQRRRDYDEYYKSSSDPSARRDAYGELSTPERARSSPTNRGMPYERYDYPEGSTTSYGERARMEHGRAAADVVSGNRGVPSYRRPSRNYRDAQ